jgi:hypothetical protein
MYVSATDITLPAGVRVSTNSSPLTLGQVGSICYEVSAELDAAAAAAGYNVPVLSPASAGPTGAYAQLVGYAKSGVGCKVLRLYFPNVTGTQDRSSLASDYCKEYRDALAGIRDGSLPLVGAGSSPGETGRLLPKGSGNASPVIRACTVF